MCYKIDYSAGEKAVCSGQVTVADRIFYSKNFATGESRFFSADQQGRVEKEISQAEFELWVGILADDEAQAKEILQKLTLGKKY
jgi:hypothetical protein